jgi:uncharacterized membrane protein
MRRGWFAVTGGAALALYPLIAVFGIQRLDAGVLWIALIVLVTLRLLCTQWFATRPAWLIGSLLAGAGLAIALVLSTDFGSWGDLRFYPVAINLAVFLLFFSSLFARMPVVERIARLREPELPPEGVRYTRVVTQVWAAFLAVNTVVASWTALYASDWVWAAYNGGVAYLLMGALFAGEYLVRRRVRRGWATS